MNVGKRITYFRKLRGLSVNRLANLAGVSQSYLRDLELGNKQPTVEYLTYICDALGVTLSVFFSEEDSDDLAQMDILRTLTTEQKEALSLFLKTLQK